MAIFNNEDPQRENNVGQFGATDESIGAYKQAAEYAKDAEYWAKLSKEGIDSIDELLVVVQKLYEQGELQAEEIQQLKADFENQDARLMQLVAETNSAVDDANNAIATIDQKIIEVQKQLDVLLGMSVTVSQLPYDQQPTGSFDPDTGEIHLGIPEGVPGKDGSVKDLSTATTGVPEPADWGFYVDKDDNTVHKALMSDIAKTFPSVQSVSYNGGDQKETGDVDVTKEKLGLGNVLDVEAYSKTEIDSKVDGYLKTYTSLSEAQIDEGNRIIGEKVLIWNGTTYDFYDVVDDGSGNSVLSSTPTKTEKRIVTVNLKEPDSQGNIDITVPTGNPSLYLGEMLMFPYDPSKNITYQGIVPADGRLLDRSGNEDLVASLIAGSLPVVTEAEWQAGAKTYFSWGPNGTSTTGAQIRMPDWTGGSAIRSPDAANDTGYKGSVINQIPYINTVNGKAPDDAGSVTVTASDIGLGNVSNNAQLKVSSNLSDLGDVNAARTNLKVDSFVQSATNTNIYSPNKSYFLRVQNDGSWGAYNASSQPVALPLAQGGTGVKTQAELWPLVRPTGATTLAAGPVGSSDATTKSYVDSADASNKAYVDSLRSVPDQWDSIINDSATPSNGTYSTGGRVRSLYSIGNSAEVTGGFRVGKTIGQTGQADVTLFLSENGGTDRLWSFRGDGSFGSPGEIYSTSTVSVRGTKYPKLSMFPDGANSNAIGGLTLFESSIDTFSSSISSIYLARRVAAGSSTGQIVIQFPTTAGTLALQGTSGRDFKKDIVDADISEAVDRVMGQRLVNYVYKDDEQERVRFGVIAEEAEMIAPQYIKHNKEPVEDILDDEGNKIGQTYRDRPSVDVNPIVMDLLGVVQNLNKRIEELESKLASKE